MSGFAAEPLLLFRVGICALDSRLGVDHSAAGLFYPSPLTMGTK